MELTPPPLPAGYRWRISKSRHVRISRRSRFGFWTPHLIITGYSDHEKADTKTLEHLHGRCVAAAEALNNALAVRDKLATITLPDGWTVEPRSAWGLRLKGPGTTALIVLASSEGFWEHPKVQVGPDTVELAIMEAIWNSIQRRDTREAEADYRRAASAA